MSKKSLTESNLSPSTDFKSLTLL